MPAYSSSPFAPTPILALPGNPAYVFGSFNDRVAPSKLQVTNVALTANVATLTVQLLEGNIPAVGSLISVQGTQSTAGLFNVTNVALASVTINATSGAGTLTFALTHANVASAADSGFAIVPAPYVGETITPPEASVVVALPPAEKALVGISAECTWSAAPSAAVVNLQVADANPQLDASFVTVDTLTFTGTQQTLRSDQAGLTANYARLQVPSHTGSETLVGKILFQ